MKRKKLLHIILLTCLLILSGCNFDAGLLNERVDHEITIADLTHTENFRTGALEHILEGELNAHGQAVGFHYDGLPSKKGKIIDGTETPLDAHAIYEAEIEVDGVRKTSYGGRSSFFPDEWTAQEVVNAINEAYDVKQLLTGNTYEGITEDGVPIRMYIDGDDQIISAFPVYEK